MMRIALGIFTAAILLAGGMWFGPWISANKGYVLIALGNTVIELTLIALILALVLSGLGLWIALRGLRLVYTVVSRSRGWLVRRQRHKIDQAFKQGMLALAIGDTDRAKIQLTEAEGGDFSGINLIALGGIAAHAGQLDAAVDYYHRALGIPESKVVASIKLSEHYCAQRDVHSALQVLSDLDEQASQQAVVIIAKAKALAQQGNWATLADKLEEWKKHLLKDVYLHWRETAAHGVYAEIASKQGANQLKAMWQSQSRKIRLNVANQAAYVRQLLAQGMYQDAETALVQFQKKSPVPELLPLFREIKLPNPAAALKLLEGWLQIEADNTAVLSVLGSVAAGCGENSLAEQVLRKALAIRHDRDDMLLLAKVKENQQQPQAALTLYKQSLGAD